MQPTQSKEDGAGAGGVSIALRLLPLVQRNAGFALADITFIRFNRPQALTISATTTESGKMKLCCGVSIALRLLPLVQL